MILTNDWIVCKLQKAIAFLALICAGTFTGSLTDFSSSTSTLEIYMPSQTITKVHVYHCTRFLNVLYQLRNAQAFLSHIPFTWIPQSAFKVRDAQAFDVLYNRCYDKMLGGF